MKKKDRKYENKNAQFFLFWVTNHAVEVKKNKINKPCRVEILLFGF